MNNKKTTTLDSSLSTKEDKKSLESTKAELEIPDPQPERAKAVLEGKNNKNE